MLIPDRFWTITFRGVTAISNHLSAPCRLEAAWASPLRTPQTGSGTAVCGDRPPRMPPVMRDGPGRDGCVRPGLEHGSAAPVS